MSRKSKLEELAQKKLALERADEEVKDLREKLAVVCEAGKIAYWEHDIVNDIFSIDDSFFTLYRTSPEQVGGYTLSSGDLFRRFVHPDDAPLALEKIRRTIKSEHDRPKFEMEHRILYGDGATGQVILRYTLIKNRDGQPVKAYGINQDITEQKLAVEALRFTQFAIDNTSDQAFWINKDGRFFYVNNAACRSLEYTREELLTMSVPDIDPTFPPEVFEQHWRNLQENGYATFESFQRAKSGRVYPTEVRANYVQFGGNEYNCAFASEITERKRLEQSIREKEARLHTLLQTIPDLVWLKDKDGVFLACNKMFERLLGAREEEIIGKTDYYFLPQEQADSIRENDRMAVAAGGPTSDEKWVTFADNGARVLLDTIKTPMFDAEGNLVGVLAVARDITARKEVQAEKAKLEDQLQQAKKMESIGRLAGGVAHDFNNMMGVILGHADLSLERMDSANPLFATIKEIRKAALRSADLTRQLLAFARKQTVAPQVLDLNATVDGILRMLVRLIGENIHLSWQPGTIRPIKVDASQVDQILTNLCINARDAISGQGKIIIETCSLSVDEAFCTEHPEATPGEFVVLSVSDSGIGLKKEDLDKIFEPFFTTKAIGQGTGLGLATIYGIVKQNNGFITVYSEPDCGTTFKIYLPSYLAETIHPLTNREATRELHRGDETILLVEDETTILDMAKLLLTRLGYQVLAVSTPGEALRAAKEHDNEIHLLMTDVIMPGMNGRDLADALRSFYPELRLLFMSGYTANVISHHGILDEGVNFIQKPFSLQTLASKVRKALCT